MDRSSCDNLDTCRTYRGYRIATKGVRPDSYAELPQSGDGRYFYVAPHLLDSQAAESWVVGDGQCINMEPCPATDKRCCNGPVLDPFVNDDTAKISTTPTSSSTTPTSSTTLTAHKTPTSGSEVTNRTSNIFDPSRPRTDNAKEIIITNKNSVDDHNHNKNHDKNHDNKKTQTPWWVWLIIALVGLLVICLLVAVLRWGLRRRPDVSPVPSGPVNPSPVNPGPVNPSPGVPSAPATPSPGTSATPGPTTSSSP